MDDEKVVAREVLGRHHSDIDDTTSSGSEEFDDEFSNTPSNIQCKSKPLRDVSSTSETSDAELSAVSSNSKSLQQSGNRKKTPPKQNTCRITQLMIDTSTPSSKAERSSQEDSRLYEVVHVHLPAKERSIPSEEDESWSSDSPEMETDQSSSSEDS